MLDGYEAGTTPNPDILCNKYLKFGALYDYVMQRMNVDWLATGHYARLKYSKEGEIFGIRFSQCYVFFYLKRKAS